jgi:uncharacterized membrane protein (DUF4010 family)
MSPFPDPLDLFVRFGAALAIGLLIGLQRQFAWVHEPPEEDEELFAGARTLALVALFGAVSAHFAEVLDEPLVFGAALLAIAAMVAIAYFWGIQEGGHGMTTEVAALLTFSLGALCIWAELVVPAALGVATTVLLALKLQTRSLVRNITREDVHATLKFAVISVIVLPILPRRGFGPPPFDVLIPHRVWLMVVLISGIGFLGYTLIKLVGPRRGVGLTGLLGGLVSSTAVTLGFSQRSRNATDLARSLSMGILLAWSVMFMRVLVEVAVVNSRLLAVLWVPLGAALVVSGSICTWLYLRDHPEVQDEETQFSNPFELRPALTFGLLYGVILLAAHWAESQFGATGVYVSSVASGLADVDAITLSMAQLSSGTGGVPLETAARAVVLAAASNTCVKGAIVLGTGNRAMRRILAPGLVLILGTAIGVVFLV